MPHESLKQRLPYRAKQLKFALFTSYKKEHIEFARKYLSIKELALFDQLPRYEKKHAVQVAKHLLADAHGKFNIDERKLAKLALLHDIGKAATKLSVVDKVLLVILNRYFPKLTASWPKKDSVKRPVRSIAKYTSINIIIRLAPKC